MHSADGHWLACEVAPEGGTRSQIWVVTTDPDDRDARRIDRSSDAEGTAELIGWDGDTGGAILTGEDGVGQSCLIDPADGTTTVLDRRSGGRLVDAGRRGAGAGRPAGLPRPDHAARAHRNRLAALRSRVDAPTPASSSTTTVPRRLRSGPEGELFALYQPAPSTCAPHPQRLRARLLRARTVLEHARLLEVTVTATASPTRWWPSASGYELDEFAVSDDLSTVATAVEHQRRQRVTDSRVRRQHSGRPDPAAGHGGQRADHQRGRVDGGDDGRRARRSRARSSWSTRGPGSGNPSTAKPSTGPRVGAAARWRRSPRATACDFTGWLYRPPPHVERSAR